MTTFYFLLKVIMGNNDCNGDDSIYLLDALSDIHERAKRTSDSHLKSYIRIAGLDTGERITQTSEEARLELIRLRLDVAEEEDAGVANNGATLAWKSAMKGLQRQFPSRDIDSGSVDQFIVDAGNMTREEVDEQLSRCLTKERLAEIRSSK